jgi:hypothetical protein
MTQLSAVIAAAGVDPWELAGEVSAADPAPVGGLARQYRAVADHAGAAMQAVVRADQATAAGYLVDGLPVHDAAAATAASRKALGDGGEHAAAVARMLETVSAELGRAKGGVDAEIAALDQALRAIDAQAHRQGPLPPAEAQAVEQAIFDRAVAAVRAHGRRITTLLDDYDAVLVSQTRTLDGLGYQAQPVPPGAGGLPTPPPGGSPTDNYRWWQSLTDEQRQQLLAHDPALVGNLNGIPAEVRDAANRARLGSEGARIDAEIADTQRRLDIAIQKTQQNPYSPDVEPPNELLARLEGLREQRSALDAVTGRWPPATVSCCCST